MPINFSAWRIISFVMRCGVGEGDGDGTGEAAGDGVAVGVWASVFCGNLVTTNPAIPTAGMNFNSVRRSTPSIALSVDSDLRRFGFARF
jgi:hypothetical protein